MLDDTDAFIADARLRIEAELRERLDRQLRLQPGPVEVQRLLAAVATQYERDLEAKVERAEAEGNEPLADALDLVQREILPEVVEKVRASLPR
jgi:hypothetical protein